MPPAHVRVPSQRPLAPSVASVANYMGDNEIILGAVHVSPGVCLTVEENPRTPQLWDGLMKGLCDQLSSFFQMRPAGSHSMSGREKEINEKRGRISNFLDFI